jgi:predicted SAM-dependent methyltransferase
LEPRYFHLGCGDKALPGYVNVDVRDTPAADLVVDLSNLEPDRFRPAAGFFSHAFFEHLPRVSQVPHLQTLRQVLIPEGFACYLGLPDFSAVAELYLTQGPGVVGPVFDLYNVYRYTHGDPEAADGWQYEQLHKGLFDSDELIRLLQEAGFGSWFIFRYAFPGEVVRVSLGFYAVPGSVSPARLETDALTFLSRFDGQFLQLDTVESVTMGQQGPVRLRIRRSPGARLAKRICWAAAVRLAQVGQD